MDKVLYKELLPHEFQEKIRRAPIAYLPLGTLEWHGPHLPLGSDGLQSEGLFRILAGRVGGIVCPPLFVGPDGAEEREGEVLYGMDRGNYIQDPAQAYAPGKLPGSAYRIPNPLFEALLIEIAGQLSRAGFQILVAHGHGPSVACFQGLAPLIKERYGLSCLHCWVEDGEDRTLNFQADHAAAGETSLMLTLQGSLVNMGLLPQAKEEWPRGVGGRDPRIYASAGYGEAIIAYTAARMEKKLAAALEACKKASD